MLLKDIAAGIPIPFVSARVAVMTGVGFAEWALEIDSGEARAFGKMLETVHEGLRGLAERN